MSEPIYVVSGLPRSGTSMMMRMLDEGGLPVITDEIRTADDDNPRGYYELEAVKKTKGDPAWLAGAEGKVVKVISQLLYDLPPDRRYKVVFMRRKLDEVLASQKTMLERRDEDNQSTDDEMKSMFASHVAEVEAWLKAADHMDVLYVSYNRLVSEPAPQLARLNDFIGGKLDVARMREVVEPALYRQRS